MKKLFSLFLVLFSILGSVSVYSYCLPADTSVISEVKLQAYTSDTKVPLNRNITLYIKVFWSSRDDSVSIENVGDPKLTNLEITGTSSANRIEADVNGNRNVREITFILKPSGLGMAYIEPVSLVYKKGKNSTPVTLRTNRFGVKVIDPVPEPGHRKFPFLWLVIFLFAAGSGVIFYSFRKKSDRFKHTEPEQNIDIDEENYLSRLKNITKSKNSDFNSALNEIIKVFRMYISKEFGISAMEATSSEIISMLEQKDTGLQEQKLKELLNRVDVLKFSGQKALQSDVDAAYVFVEAFLESRLRDKKEKEASKERESKRKGIKSIFRKNINK